jgi:beta-aspartyl-peptidase (threonine type)
MRKTFFYFSFLLLILANTSYAQSDEEQVKVVLTAQVESWNRGDIEGFMRGYWNSDSTMFNSGGNLERGYKDVLARYKKTYGTKEKMGRLEFSELVIRKISPTSTVAMGAWKLHRAKDQPWGRFTLIVEKKPEGWRITHDHTSSAEK